MALSSTPFGDLGDPEAELRANYDALRRERGWDWATLADSLRRQDAATLAVWAESQVEAPPVKRAAKGRETTAAHPTSTR